MPPIVEKKGPGEVNTTEETGKQNDTSKPKPMYSGNKGKAFKLPN